MISWLVVASPRRTYTWVMTDESKLRAEFDRFDTDKNGYIDEGEFRELVKALGVDISSQAVATAYLAIDVNGNKRIEFGEFSAWWVKYQGG